MEGCAAEQLCFLCAVTGAGTLRFFNQPAQIAHHLCARQRGIQPREGHCFEGSGPQVRSESGAGIAAAKGSETVRTQLKNDNTPVVGYGANQIVTATTP